MNNDQLIMKKIYIFIVCTTVWENERQESIKL